jgi:hypothetical protein
MRRYACAEGRVVREGNEGREDGKKKGRKESKVKQNARRRKNG